VIQIVDRVSSAPSSPTPGARYIVAAAYSTFEQEDIIEADGQGGFIEYTPPTDCGWMAYVQDEDRNYQFKGSAWVALSSEPATQAEMEAFTSTEKPVTAGRQHFHPGHLKAWAFVAEGTTSITTDYGCASVADNGAGLFTITFDTAFSATGAYTCIANHARGTADTADNRACWVSTISSGAKTTTTFAHQTLNGGNTLIDSVEAGVGYAGDF
jgi:hypothetical protein